MALKFLNNLDLGGYQITNVLIDVRGSDPGSPAEGQVWYNTTSHQLKYRDNGATQVVGTGAGSGDFSTNTSTSVDGELVLFNGTSGKSGKRATGSGIVKLASGVLGFATASTDYAPATSGSAALKGNGSGGFAAATLNDVGAATADYSLASHKLTNLTDPASAQDAATKNYVDVTIQGLQPKPTATVATTGALPAGTYSNGTSGVGATFTVTATGTTTVDGHVLAANELVLVKDQASGFQNGLYTVTTAGTTGVATVLTRHVDMDQTAEFSGALVPVGSTGTANANSLWLANPSGTVTVGTTAIPFTQLNGATDLVPGTGIGISGNTISLSTPVTVANGGTGAGTITGLVKGNGTSAFTAAVSGTDYAPATATTNILKGNGSGGFTSAKFTQTIGDGSTTAIAVTDGLGTIDKVAVCRDATTGAQVYPDITYSSTQVTFTFATAPASNAYKVVVVG